MKVQSSYTAQELALYLEGELVGDPSVLITGVGTLADARPDQISFLSNPRYVRELVNSSAGLILLERLPDQVGAQAYLKVAGAYQAYAKVSRLFSRSKEVLPGIDSTAVVAARAMIAKTAQICAGAVISEDAVIADYAYIGPNVVVGDASVVGERTRIEANVTLYPSVTVGRECIIHSGAVIGADGFGFAPSSEGWLKIEQLGSVVINDQVEIGANTTIDRGAINDTIIERGVKLDNQIQIAHNVRIGEGTAIAGGTCIAGSTQIGKRCTIAGMSGITGHLSIADGTHITAMTLVSRSIEKPGAYSSGTGMELHKQWKKNVVRFRQLDQLAKKVKVLEEQVRQLSAKESE